MRARTFSHAGITVSDFNKAVRFYWEIFGCPLVGVADTPSDRVRAFFEVDGAEPRCKIGWIRVPGGAMLEIFEFQPHQPPRPMPWNGVGLTHFSFNVRTPRVVRLPVSKGVECLTKPERSPRGHSFFFCKDFDGNPIELMDLGLMYHVLKWLGPLGGWLFGEGVQAILHGHALTAFITMSTMATMTTKTNNLHRAHRGHRVHRDRPVRPSRRTSNFRPAATHT